MDCTSILFGQVTGDLPSIDDPAARVKQNTRALPNQGQHRPADRLGLHRDAWIEGYSTVHCELKILDRVLQILKVLDQLFGGSITLIGFDGEAAATDQIRPRKRVAHCMLIIDFVGRLTSG